MPTIKNVGNHVDQLHDGRPFPQEAVRTITDSELALDHYQARLKAGTVIGTDIPVPSGEPVDGYDALSVTEVIALLDTVDPDAFAAIKAYEAAHKDRSTIRDHHATEGAPS